jgi:branched-chain amino acid transport system ATP-binding protein
MLTLRGVDAGYAGTPVLRHVDLVVPDGSVVALLGANGAGKTTLLRVASGLLRPTAGSVLVDGVDLTGGPPHQLVAAGVCHVPEGRGVFRSLTVRENLALYADPSREAESLELAVQAFPSLGRRLAILAGQLSGGEQQMLALSRAYVQRPKVVLLDEVSMGLAPKVVDEIFEFLGMLAAKGTSLLLVEQYVTRALEAADWVYLLSRGEVVFAGEPNEIDGDAVFKEYVGVSAGA